MEGKYLADFDKNRFQSKNQDYETPLSLFNVLAEVVE